MQKTNGAKNRIFKGADDFALMRFLNFGASGASGGKFIAPHFYPSACSGKNVQNSSSASRK
nr:hypothetical protein [uncultured Campylobacter sp.]